MNFDIATLPDDSTLLKQIRLLRAQLFGRKSEKIKPGSSVMSSRLKYGLSATSGPNTPVKTVKA